MPKVMLKGYRCERCGHEWLPRGWYCPACEPDRLPPSKRAEKFQHTCQNGAPAEPRVCPKCKSPYWDIPRGTTPRGRPRVFHDGQGVVVLEPGVKTPNDR